MDLATDPESAGHFLAVVDRHTERMQAMVSDLLDLSRIESPVGRFEPVKLDLGQFLADLHARHDEALRTKGLHWETQVPASVHTIVANPYLLRLVLDNLVDNAIKFTDAGGRVQVACRDVGSPTAPPASVSIEVGDTGCGIPEDEQGRVFERFYQVERARSGTVRGTGLGLSIVRHAVGDMGGTVDLQSQVGQGTRVMITIPQPDRPAAI